MVEILGTLIPIVAILCTIGLPLSIPIVYLVLNYRKRRRLLEQHHAERMAAIERGMDVPPLPMEVLGVQPTSRSTLLPGLIWLFVGLALLVALRDLNGFIGFGSWSVWGLVPTGVGIAYLIYYAIEGRKQVQPPKEINAQRESEKKNEPL